jgi:hypothetical protein
MEISAEDLKRHYREMSDGELLAIDPVELTATAAKVHAGEMERRGLNTEDADQHSEAELEEETGERWLSAGIFRFEDEIRVLLPVLRHHGLQAEIETDPDELIWMGMNTFPANRLLVPAAQLDEARGIIENFANSQELAAREDAGPPPLVVRTRFEDGVFKPLEPVAIEERTEIEVQLLRNE